MIRVLQVYPQMNNAGTERVIFNLYENVDTSLVQFDFLVECPGELDDKIRDLGGRIYYVSSDSKNQYYSELLKFFKAHPEYRVVHTHTHARMDIVLKAAKVCGVPCRIAHSHNARNDLPKAAAFVKGLTSIPMERAATHFFACSSNAAKWLFPHRVKECKVLYNGIKLDDYLYCEENRKRVRAQLGIGKDDFVMIHVGRFARQKNHEFLVRILENYAGKDCTNWKMLLVGEGPLEDLIKHQVAEAGLFNHVVFLGARRDVNELYSGADMFLFPSLHEGLGIVTIEAQASGLPCVVSDAVPSEADMEVGLLRTIRLNDSLERWANAVYDTCGKHYDRVGKKNEILNGKYNIKKIAAEMQDFYLRNSV